MKLPLHIARKLQELLLPGQKTASSGMQHNTVTKMLDDGLLQKQQVGKTRSLLFITQKENVAAYLQNHFGISDLDQYIQVLESEEKNRAANIIASGNSKLQTIRTFKGFLVNTYQPIKAIINDKQVTIEPLAGRYTFIHSYESFLPDKNVTIVGIENPENFNAIEKQQYLFSGIQPLFVSLYPQSGNLVKWLLSIPHPYLHFGDLDLAGIGIYQNSFKKHLGTRASFFVPPDTESLLQQFGNRDLFNKQYNPLTNYEAYEEQDIQQLMGWIMKYKKVLEQEIFIGPERFLH